MIFEQLSAGGCRSYLVGCAETCAAALIDPEISLIDRYLALTAREGLRIHYLIDTHTHADHFSATQQLAHRLDVPVVMHRLSPAPFVDLRSTTARCSPSESCGSRSCTRPGTRATRCA